MQIDILTPESKLFSGEASSIIFPGISGNFELLDNHAPMIAALRKGQIELLIEGNKKYIQIENGFIECVQNKVSVLIAGGSMS
jgi:F-type H+-transporting ATPase subunit epsilon|tara:strand:+ start:13238 stop:13486 length:249 start_codon:yes stop_codon:yes gene_type:complete